MKKIVSIFLLLFVLFNNKVLAAETPKDFYCTYDVYNPYLIESGKNEEQNKTTDKVLTKIKIVVEDFKNSKYSINYYIYKNQKWNSIKGSSTLIDSYSLFFLNNGYGDTSKNYVTLFNGELNNTCPDLYSNKDPNGMGQNIYLDTSYIDPNNSHSYYMLSFNEFKMRSTSSDNDWKDPSYFYSNNGGNANDPEDESKTCNYQFNLKNQNYKNLDVSFIKAKAPNGGYVYKFKLVDEGEVQPTNIPATQDIKVHAQTVNVILEKSFLNTIFAGKDCLDKTKICSFWADTSDKEEFILSDDISRCASESGDGDYSTGDGNLNSVVPIEDPTLDYGSSLNCKNLLGPNLTEAVKAGIKIVQIVGAIIAIVRGMMVLLPAIIAHDSDGLRKAAKTLTYMGIILVVIFLFPGLMRLIGKIAGFDISCLT